MTAIEFLSRIRPRESDDDWITDPDSIASHPLHRDPNFDALTFGDKRGTGGTGGSLAKHLEPGDILGFYAGMGAYPGDDNVNRHLYGFMTVRGVHNLSKYEGEEYRDKLQSFPENAHAKRLEAAGEPKHEDVVIVDGEEPAKIFERPIKLSERIDRRPWYQVTESFAEEFGVTGGQMGIGRKPPIKLNLKNSDFLSRLSI